MTKHPLTKPFAEMEWLQAAEERAGVEIEWQEMTADWGQKKGALLSSGDIPDLFVGPNAITDADFAMFPGLFQDLRDLIESHGPNVKTMFEAKSRRRGRSRRRRTAPSTACRNTSGSGRRPSRGNTSTSNGWTISA